MTKACTAAADSFITPHAIAPGFIAPPASLTLAEVKFVPYNTPASPRKISESHFIAPAKLATGGMKCQGYTSEAF